MRLLPKHLPALDGLRGIAILLVILTHAAGGWQAAASLIRDTSTWPTTFLLPSWLSVVSSQAVHGVTLFFVVSAFTLTLSLAKGGDLASYAVRRIARVGPGYWLAGICYTIVAGLAPRLWAPGGVAASDLAVAAVFGSAWQGEASVAVVPGGWSVACEVTFYAALPLLLWIIQGRLWRAAGLTFLACIAVQMVARHAMMHGGWNYVPQYINPLVQAPVFLFGITAAIIFQRLSLPRITGATAFLLVLAIFGVPYSPLKEWYMLHHFLFAALAAAAVLISATHPPKLLASAVLRRVGEVSYSMYLVHFAVLAPSLLWAERLAPGNDWHTLVLHVGLTTGSSFGLAGLLHRWVELPGIAFGRAVIRSTLSTRPS